MKPVNVKDPAVRAAMQALEEAYAVDDLQARSIADGAPVRSAPLTPVVITALRRRCLAAIENGSVNIVVDSRLLIELMNGFEHGLKQGYTSHFTV